MERTVYDEQLDVRFKVDVKDVAKQRKGITFSNASNCCGEPLAIVKQCSKCKVAADATQCTHKLWKKGKVSVLVPVEKLEQIDEAQEQVEELRITASLSRLPDGFFERVGSSVKLLPVKKGEADYALFCERFKAASFAVGTGLFRGSQFEFVAWLGEDGAVRLTKLVEQAQFYEAASEALHLPAIDGEVGEMVASLVQKMAKTDYDFTQFSDNGIKMKQDLIERIALGEEIQEFKPQIVEQRKDDMKARLKARLEAMNG